MFYKVFITFSLILFFSQNLAFAQKIRDDASERIHELGKEVDQELIVLEKKFEEIANSKRTNFYAVKNLWDEVHDYTSINGLDFNVIRTDIDLIGDLEFVNRKPRLIKIRFELLELISENMISTNENGDYLSTINWAGFFPFDMDSFRFFYTMTVALRSDDESLTDAIWSRCSNVSKARINLSYSINFDKLYDYNSQNELYYQCGAFHAWYLQGQIYQNGYGVQKDIKKASTLYEPLAMGFHHEGAYEYARLAETGTVIPKDLSLSASIYYELVNSNVNNSKAYSALKKMSDNGFPEAQVRLGWLYYSKRGRSDWARTLIQKAIDQGYKPAEESLERLNRTIERDSNN